MKAEYLIGSEALVNNTVQDFMDFFSQMTPKTRRDSSVQLAVGDDIYDIRCIQCSQSDQSEKHELKVWIKAEWLKAVPSKNLDAIQKRSEALKSNHPEWADIIDAVVHPEDFL